jgi:FtsZ-binding cell division protein ZapB
MEQLLTTGLPYVIAVAFLGVVYTLKAPIEKTLKAIEAKSQQILGQTVYGQAKTFAIDEIKSLLKQYPESTIEDIVARAVEALGVKFGVNLLSETEIKAIITSAIAYIQQNIYLNDIVNSNVATAQQKYLAGTIQSTDRKTIATNGILLDLKSYGVPTTDNFKTTIDNKIESAVLKLKTPEQQVKEESNVLQVQVTTLNTAKAQLEKENADLKQKLSSIQAYFPTQNTVKPVEKPEESTTVTK